MKTFEMLVTEALWDKYELNVHRIFDKEGNELVNLPLFKIKDGEYTVIFEDGSKTYIKVCHKEIEEI